MLRRLIAGAATLAATGALLLTSAAGATTRGCVTRDGGNCGALITNADTRLELTVSGNPNTVRAGRALIATRPAIARAQDWDIRPAGTDPDFVVIRWAPFGFPRNLCVTATHDVPGFSLRVEVCNPGSAGSSHQIWHKVNQSGNRAVYQNLANNLVMAAQSQTNGAAVIGRTIGNGTGGNKVWSRRTFAP
jgi:hypothetical protein